MFDPVAHIEQHHPQYKIQRGPLPGGALSCIDFRNLTITVCEDLDDAGFRSSVCHEGVHLDRGDRCSLSDTALDARREAAVEREAAARLISCDALAAVLVTGATDEELAAAVGTDVHLFRVRIRMLSDEQWDGIHGVVREQQRWTVA